MQQVRGRNGFGQYGTSKGYWNNQTYFELETVASKKIK
jgi:hypothetical protein